MYKAVIIDDEKWVVKSLAAILQKQDYFDIIDKAYNGQAGLELILEKKPDLAFVDIKMPGISGLELLNIINQEKLPTICVIISGHAEFAYVQKAMNQNAIGYCLKPFSPAELGDVVLRAYERISHSHMHDYEKQIEANPLEQRADAQISAKCNVKNKIVKSILDYVHNDYAEGISIQLIAKRCNVNANYASQIFNQEMGETFSSYLTDLRLKEAERLLLTTDLPVSTISMQVGYHDYFYFAKVFKKAKNATPTEFRNVRDGR